MQFNTRLEMIRSIVPPRGVYAEIGVFAGAFSKQLVGALTPKILYLLDVFEGEATSGDQDGNNLSTVNLGEVYASLAGRPGIVPLKGDSAVILDGMPDNSLDMVYIDGDHSYEGCKRDLEASFRKVRPGGWILGHDYEMNMQKARTQWVFGVKRAVDEFCSKANQSISAKALDGCVSYAIRVNK
jgi:predicted O-methyltransferase YrrM